MGCCESSVCFDIDAIPKKDDKFVTVKILLLGAGESGKSTILKQMRIIHKDGFSLNDRIARKPAVYTDVVNSMVSLIYGGLQLKMQGLRKDILAIHLTDHIRRVLENSWSEMSALNDRVAQATGSAGQARLAGDARKDDLQVLRSVASRNIESALPQHVADLIQSLWDDPVMKKLYEKRNLFQINDAAAYFFDELDRIRAVGYLPSDEDILVTRVKSTGIQEMRYNIKKVLFSVYDMPGQRSQRRKWLNYFQEVDAIIFVCAVSEYDQAIREDNRTNRIYESVSLFEIIANNQYFLNSQIILFMNKKDLFVEKLDRSLIKNYFKGFKVQNSYANGMRFFRRMFLEKTLKWEGKRRLHVHETCATDTSQLSAALAEATEHVVAIQLERAGLI